MDFKSLLQLNEIILEIFSVLFLGDIRLGISGPPGQVPQTGFLWLGRFGAKLFGSISINATHQFERSKLNGPKPPNI